MKKVVFILIILGLVLMSCMPSNPPNDSTSNNPPTQPSNPSPNDGATNVSITPTLSWEASDPDGDTLTYNLYLSTESNPELYQEGIETNSIEVGPLKNGTTYYWRVEAKDGKDGVTSSPIWSFTTTNPPTQPSNPSPSDGQTDVSLNPTLSWEASDPDGDSLTYDIYFGTDSNPPLLESNLATNTYNPATLNSATTYYWKIVVKDGKGGVTEGPVWNFTTTNPPIAPSNPTPSNGATNILLTPTLSWEASDPDGDTLTYNLYLSTESNPELYQEGIETNSIEVGPLKNGTTYYWRVEAKDGKGGVTESPIWSFTTENNEPFIKWQKTLGGSGDDYAYSIQQTSDGGYIVAGYTDSNDGDVSGNHGNYDYWIVKLDINGNIEWQKALGGSDKDTVHSIQQTSDGGYIVAGTSYSDDGDVSGNHVKADYWIIKLNEYGNIEWQKSLGGSGHDYAYSIQQTSDGGYIVAGYTDSNDGDVSGNHGNADYWIIKLNEYGNIEWQKALGGSDTEIAYSIQQTEDGGYIVAGYTDSNDGDVSGNHGNADYWIIKLNEYGNIEWQKALGGSNSDYAYSIQQTTDGGYIVVGFADSTDGDVDDNDAARDAWIIKLDSNGNIEWQKALGGNSKKIAYEVQQTNDGGYVVAGFSGIDNNAWIVKLDSKGNVEWQKYLGGSSWDYAHSIQQTTDGGYIVAGNTMSNDGDVSGNHGEYDYWIVKLGE